MFEKLAMYKFIHIISIIKEAISCVDRGVDDDRRTFIFLHQSRVPSSFGPSKYTLTNGEVDLVRCSTVVISDHHGSTPSKVVLVRNMVMDSWHPPIFQVHITGELA